MRELLTYSMLVALGGADAQVRGHVNGNLRVGNTRARLLAALTVLLPFIGYPRTLNGLAARCTARCPVAGWFPSGRCWKGRLRGL